MWNGVTALVDEIRRCENAGATIAAVAMVYASIDTVAFLSLPAGREVQGKADFIAWVDKYLTGDKDQPYQYQGLDVYGARCALLHAFGSEADFHDKNPNAKKYGYHDGGKHGYNPEVNAHLVIIGTASLINDVLHAIEAFINACKADADLRQRVEGRLPKMLATFPFKS